MARHLAAAALAILAISCSRGGAGGMASAGDNPLLGTWQLSNGNPASCGASITFTPNSEATTYPDPSENESHQVSYNASPTVVYVIGNAGSTQYDVTGPDTMQWHGTSTCAYRRAG